MHSFKLTLKAKYTSAHNFMLGQKIMCRGHSPAWSMTMSISQEKVTLICSFTFIFSTKSFMFLCQDSPQFHRSSRVQASFSAFSYSLCWPLLWWQVLDMLSGTWFHQVYQTIPEIAHFSRTFTPVISLKIIKQFKHLWGHCFYIKKWI